MVVFELCFVECVAVEAGIYQVRERAVLQLCDMGEGVARNYQKSDEIDQMGAGD